MQHWTPCELEGLAGCHWRIVPLETCKLPGLLHEVMRRRAVLARTRDGRWLLLMRMPRGLAALDQQRFFAERLPGARAWILALEEGEGPGLEGAPELPPGPVRLQWGEHNWPELYFGPQRLGCAVHPWMRDWTWAWHPTCGPVVLRIYVERTQTEIESWLRARRPDPWTLGPDGLFHSSYTADVRMAVAEGSLRLSRGYLQAPDEQVAWDHAMLLDLCSGGLGELRFDLFDGDYFVFQAAGETRESLYDYLHARASRDGRHRWNLFPVLDAIDARAETVDASAALIGEAFGWGHLNHDELCEAFRRAIVPSLPRRIEIRVRDSVFTDEVRMGLVRAQPRVQFWFQLDSSTRPV
ncbi:MAG: hypothetical protein AB1758_08845 [Candidatus Eremiobacterota bacterium]